MKWSALGVSARSHEASTTTHKYIVMGYDGRTELAVFAYDSTRIFGRRKVATTYHDSIEEAKAAAERHAKTQ